MKGSGMIKHCRERLGLTQKAFGVEIAKRTNNPKPYHQVCIAGWENGHRSPRRNVREVCREESALWCIEEIGRIANIRFDDNQSTLILEAIIESQS